MAETNETTKVVQVVQADPIGEMIDTACKVVGALGAGIVIGTALRGVNLAFVAGPLKLITDIGILGLSDAAGEISGSQLAKRANEARTAWNNYGVSFCNNLAKAEAEQKQTK